jgi:PAS domain S-box-containing protein
MKKQTNNAVQNKINLQALKESDERFRSIVLWSPDAIIVTDAMGKIKYMNPAAEKVFNRKLESFVGKDFGLALVNGESTEIDIIRPGKDPGVGDMHVVETEWLGEKAHLITIRDITGRKQMEVKLKQQADAMGTATDGMAILNEEGEYVYLNKAHAKIYGYENEGELIGKSWRILYDSDVIQRFEQEFMPELSREGSWFGEFIGKKKNGVKFPQEISLTVIDDGGLICVVHDITKRKRTEEALRQSEERYRTILDDIQEGYFEVDLAGNFTFFNDSMCRILGYPEEEMMGMNNRQFTDKKNANKLFKTFNEVYRTGESTKEFDWQIIRKDGIKRYIEVSVSSQKNSSGQPIGFQGIARDITERKQSEEALRESEEKYRNILENNQENRRYRLSISVGCSYYNPENPCSLDELMAHADKSMYEQKQNKKSLLPQGSALSNGNTQSNLRPIVEDL